jgi:hypothetical protein
MLAGEFLFDSALHEGCNIGMFAVQRRVNVHAIELAHEEQISLEIVRSHTARERSKGESGQHGYLVLHLGNAHSCAAFVNDLVRHSEPLYKFDISTEYIATASGVEENHETRSRYEYRAELEP